jgi:hypothetical protein
MFGQNKISHAHLGAMLVILQHTNAMFGQNKIPQTHVAG